MTTTGTLCFLCDKPAQAKAIPAPSGGTTGGRSRVTCPHCKGYTLHDSARQMSIPEVVRRQISEMARKQYGEDETGWLHVSEELVLHLMGKPAQ